MAFENKVPEWKAAGTEPPESLKESGFTAGYKPPAAYFNWFWFGVSKCLIELQQDSVPCATLAGVSLNTAIDTGIYAYNTRCTEKPSANSGSLIALKFAADNDYISQLALAHTINRLYIRYSADGGAKWTDWAELAYASETAPSGFGLGGVCTDISGKDLLTEVIQKSGFYRGSNVVNAPNPYWWYYVVTAGNDTTNVIAFGTNGSFKTAHFANGATSVDWKEFSLSSHKHTAENVGALPISGGTLTGDLFLTSGWGALWANISQACLSHYRDKEDSSNATFLCVQDAASIADKLLLALRVNNEKSTYRIYGEHNKPKPADIGAFPQSEADKVLARRIYQANGWILNASNSDVKGSGAATVTIEPSGLARIDFTIQITQDGTKNDLFKWGINRHMLRERNGSIPLIAPTTGGTLTVYDSNGVLIRELVGHGGFLSTNSEFWVPARVYDTNGADGQWQEAKFKAGYQLVGTCYGVVES